MREQSQITKNYTINGITELAKYLNISRSTANKLVSNGAIPYIQIWKKKFFSPADADAAVKYTAKKEGGEL